MDGNRNIEKLSWVSWSLIMVSIFFVLISLVPFLMNYNPIVDLVSEPDDESVSDIVTPLISIASVAMMFLAFYMQYRANKLVIKQFERSQFESRFFQLLKMHKENSTIILDSLRGGEDEALGVSGLEPHQKRRFEYIISILNNDYERRKNSPKEAESDPRKLFTKVWSYRWEDSFGHYFRHLFQLVRFVVTRDFLSYEQKRDYMRIVRASLSTYEQIFLYYDWLSGDGCTWEDDENRYFTDYRMIHNINPKFMISDLDIREMSPFKEYMASGNYMMESGRENDELFEFQSRKDRL